MFQSLLMLVKFEHKSIDAIVKQYVQQGYNFEIRFSYIKGNFCISGEHRDLFQAFITYNSIIFNKKN